MMYPNAQQRIDRRLQEGKQVGTLYHFTNERGITEILKTKSMILHAFEAGRQFTGHTGKQYYFGVSMTRLKKPVFPIDVINIESKFVYRLGLDGNHLSNRFQIKPVAELGFRTGAKHPREFEELIIAGTGDKEIQQGLPLVLKSGDFKEVAIADVFYHSVDYALENRKAKFLSNMVHTLLQIRKLAKSVGAEMTVYKTATGVDTDITVDEIILRAQKAYGELMVQ